MSYTEKKICLNFEDPKLSISITLSTQNLSIFFFSHSNVVKNTESCVYPMGVLWPNEPNLGKYNFSHAWVERTQFYVKSIQNRVYFSDEIEGKLPYLNYVIGMNYGMH